MFEQKSESAFKKPTDGQLTDKFIKKYLDI